MNAHLDTVATVLLDRFQHGFPLVPNPFRQVGELAGLSESETIAHYREMKERGLITRVGAVVAPNAVGASTLAAIAVPPGEIDAVAALISDEPYVNHNYERENALNIWFVVTAPSARELEETLDRIERKTGCKVHDLRLEQAFHLDLGFSVMGVAQRRNRLAEPDTAEIIEGDRELLAEIQDGLALVPRPFMQAAQHLGRTEAEVLNRLRALNDAHVIRRFGVIVRHRAMGIGANAMTVWDIPDDLAGEIGDRLAAENGVNLCYRRRRSAGWDFNLYCMVHGRTRGEALDIITRLNTLAGASARAHDVLFSRRCFKQTGARFSRERRVA